MFNIEKTKLEINETLLANPLYKRIIVQFPDGLLDNFANQVYDFLFEKNIECIIAGDPSYGACDLPTLQASIFDVDAIFHFGHSTFAFPPPNIGIPICYFSVEAQVEINWELIIKELQNLQWKTIGIVTTIQHTTIVEKSKPIFKSNGLNSIIFKEGQILGCNQNRADKIAKEVDGFLVIAGGNFHASPIVVSTGKSTLRYDPFNHGFQLFDESYRKTYLQKRFAVITKAKEAKNWGVLLSLKSGQLPKDKGKKTINLLQKNGKKAIAIPMFRIDPQHLFNFYNIDAWVINLCPRIATDDFISFNKPIVTARELLVVLGLLDWETFVNPVSNEQLLIIEE